VGFQTERKARITIPCTRRQARLQWSDGGGGEQDWMTTFWPLHATMPASRPPIQAS